MNIVIVAPNWIGDLVMAQSLLCAIKVKYPTAKITVLASNHCLGVVSLMPEVNNSLALPFKHGELQLKARWNFAKKLKSKNFDVAFILPNSFKSALIPFFAKIPVRVGWLGEMRFGLLTNYIKLPKKHIALQVARYQALLSLKLDPSAEAILNPSSPLYKPKLTPTTNQIDDIYKKLKLDKTKKIAALCPSAAFGRAKCWPADHFATLAGMLIKDGYQVFILGGSGDTEIAKSITTKVKNKNLIDLTNKTNLTEVSCLMAGVNVAVCNDSGLMHIAAAVGVNVVAIYGSTSYKNTPPLADKCKVISLNLSCSPCSKRECPLKHHKCMQDINPEDVLVDILQLSSS